MGGDKKMNSKAERKDAINKFKEQKSPRGVFAVRCMTTGSVWVGSSLNLNATKNRLWFGLRLGAHTSRALQDEWNSHGEQAFQYDILEKLKEDTPSLIIKDVLKEKSHQWLVQLGATAI